MEQKTLLVVAGIVQKGKKVLIAQRMQDTQNDPLKWEFPGGKVELLEDPKTAIRRELQEELGITVSVGELFDYVSYIYKRKGKKHHVVVLFFLCTTHKEPKCVGCEQVRWVLPKDLFSYDFVAADVKILKKLGAK
ncbi:(deoxy)nucleoside triphosphate pyrophosphohydrolase [Candidatus Woesearchaeota archaeon]|nr:(deoxy)nucleoside triphosphate pyrophosphohydrolase [Candidatus Woesearchaeota archaeon]